MSIAKIIKQLASSRYLLGDDIDGDKLQKSTAKAFKSGETEPVEVLIRLLNFKSLPPEQEDPGYWVEHFPVVRSFGNMLKPGSPTLNEFHKWLDGINYKERPYPRLYT